MLELAQILLGPTLYFALLMFILRYARLKPKLSQALGKSLIITSVIFFFLPALMHIKDSMTISDLILYFYSAIFNSTIILIVGITLLMGANQKYASKHPEPSLERDS